jgi:TRAP-type transport system periplasmic protein
MLPTNATWHLTYSHTNFPGDDYTVYGHTPLARSIEKATGEKVRISLQGGESGVKSDQIWENVKSGKSDIGWLFTGLYPGRFSAIEVSTLPYLYSNTIVGSRVSWRLFEKYAAIREQFRDVKVLSIWITQPYFIAGRNRFYRVLSDFEGQKIRAALGPPSDFVKELGAIPCLVTRNEVNRAFQAGDIAAALLPAEAYLAFKTWEVAPFITQVATVATVNALVMNLAKWNSISADTQEMIMKASGESAAVHFAREVFEKSALDLQKVVASARGKIQEYRLPGNELKNWITKSGRPVWETWVNTQSQAGLAEAQVILEDARLMSERLSTQNGLT